MVHYDTLGGTRDQTLSTIRSTLGETYVLQFSVEYTVRHDKGEGFLMVEKREINGIM